MDLQLDVNCSNPYGSFGQLFKYTQHFITIITDLRHSQCEETTTQPMRLFPICSQRPISKILGI